MEPIQTLEDLISMGKFSEALDFVEALSKEERQQWQIQNLMGIICAHSGHPRRRVPFSRLHWHSSRTIRKSYIIWPIPMPFLA